VGAAEHAESAKAIAISAVSLVFMAAAQLTLAPKIGSQGKTVAVRYALTMASVRNCTCGAPNAGYVGADTNALRRPSVDALWRR
jgi:hypothetical protein